MIGLAQLGQETVVVAELQEWNTQKKCERLIKTTLLGKNKENLSAIEPVKYAARFKRFCEKSVFVYQEDQSQ